MRDVRLYDAYTLKDGNEYVVIGITDYNSKKYLLLSKVIGNDELSDKDFKYVECFENNGMNNIREITDSSLLNSLAKVFSKQIENL